MTLAGVPHTPPSHRRHIGGTSWACPLPPPMPRPPAAARAGTGTGDRDRGAPRSGLPPPPLPLPLPTAVSLRTVISADSPKQGGSRTPANHPPTQPVPSSQCSRLSRPAARFLSSCTDLARIPCAALARIRWRPCWCARCRGTSSAVRY